MVLQFLFFSPLFKLQADPTKVETVQDVLARAAAKGLLGGIIPEAPKTGKKGKGKRNRAASATSKSSSPSSQDRKTGGEPGDAQDPAASSEPEEEKDEGAFKDSEEKEDDKGGKGEKKKRHKAKKHSKQTKRVAAVQKQQPRSQKKPTKKKVNKMQQTRSKPRRIPRLTLTLISSAKPSSQLSLMTALAHRISGNPAMKSQQTDVNSPVRPAPPTPIASKRQNRQPEEGSTLKGTTKPARQAAKPQKVAITQEVPKAADIVLPPISSPSSGSPPGRSGSSISQPPSQSISSQIGNMSESSSVMSLPGL